ncbi:MAG: D-alanyl-D-alanine carboxypeptidase/D-alanyl-D-alanine-endopeptidase [Ilumatobacteraceae bacterium]|nr:D-alanyl-D-alanine carboxypeptidase/D-alanyl-D-alanine-endopeptidase [Ilumatobacteraceae bacterium]
MGMRVDLVSAPSRYPRGPLFILLAIAVVPTVALVALVVWSDREADSYDAARDEAALVQDALDESRDSTLSASDEAAAALPTGLFNYRRAPREIAVLANGNMLAEALEPMYNFINDDSCVAVALNGHLISSKNPATPVIPASTQKLLIAAVALETLGGDYTFTTTIASQAAVDGVVEGDIYLIGGGDPLLVSDDYPIDSDRYPEFSTTSLDRLADEFVDTGVTRVNGAVIGDGSRYDDEFVIASWGDGVAFVDGGPYDALLVNDSRVRGRSSRQRDPNEAAAREMARLLRNRGISVATGWASGVADPAAPIVATVTSEPLSAAVREMLTTSDNNTAEMLLKEIGFADSGEGTVATGLTVVDRTLRGWGIPMDGVRLVDGSGLSPDNRITCAALIGVLNHDIGGVLSTGLPLAGRTGTLADEFTESVMAGRLVAKTGTLSNPPAESDPPAVKALAGYLPTDVGVLQFAIVQSGPDVTSDRKYETLWLALTDRLDTYPAGPEFDLLGPQ